MGWRDDKRDTDRFIPQIKRILGEELISEAPLVEDRDHNTDLMVLTLEAYRIGCRVRKYPYFDRYGHQFTIRASRPRTGYKTEFEKIREGWGDFFLYAFSDPGGTFLFDWTLVDLSAFRRWIEEADRAGRVCHVDARSNVDGSSDFYVYDRNRVPPGVIRASGS